jgi:hypothetical protein
MIQTCSAGRTVAGPVIAPLAEVLGPIHERWIDEARRCLSPASRGRAGLWDYWGLVRYLDDQFLVQYHRERALVEEMQPYLPSDEVKRLRLGAFEISTLRREAGKWGRRPGAAVQMAAVVRRLLERLPLWCAEIELAATRISRLSLGPEGARLLRQMEATSLAAG